MHPSVAIKPQRPLAQAHAHAAGLQVMRHKPADIFAGELFPRMRRTDNQFNAKAQGGEDAAKLHTEQPRANDRDHAASCSELRRGPARGRRIPSARALSIA